MGACVWRVEVIDPDSGIRGWSVWADWVDRATAEAESDAATVEGYRTRIVPSVADDLPGASGGQQ